MLNVLIYYKKNVLKNISFHQNCKCGCLLDKKVCNNLQKWNKNKCRCKCLIIKKCKIGYSLNINNCRCERKKLARLIDSEECDLQTDVIKNDTKSFFKNKTLTKKVENCKSFIGIRILFLLVLLIIGGIITYFYFKLRNNVLPY